MTYDINKIIKDVRVTLDQNMQSDTLAALGDVDTLALDDIIMSKIVEGVRRVHEAAPTYLLENAVPVTVGESVIEKGDALSFGDSIHWEDDTSGYVMLPEDFMRLIMFRMSDWERTAYRAISVYDKGYDRQSSRFRGVRGTPQKPLCVVSFRPEGRVLEFYSTKDNNATVTMATYLPYPKIDDNGGIRISKRCYEAAIYAIASLVAATYGDSEKATILTQLSKSIMQES